MEVGSISAETGTHGVDTPAAAGDSGGGGSGADRGTHGVL